MNKEFIKSVNADMEDLAKKIKSADELGFWVEVTQKTDGLDENEHQFEIKLYHGEEIEYDAPF